MAGIPVTGIKQPGAIAYTSGINRALVSGLQLLTPQNYPTYIERYGDEAQQSFFMWLATYGGMEEVKNRDFQWWENYAKLMPAVSPAADVVANTNGGSITVTLASGDHYNSGTQSPLRQGETLRVASTNVEGEVISIDPSTPGAFTFVFRPKRGDKKLASAGSTSLLATDVLLFGGIMDAGEGSDSRAALAHLDQKFTNTITEMRDSWSATDLAEMTEVFYNSGVSGSAPSGGEQAGTSYFTYKGLAKTNVRWQNNIENKLMRGDIVSNSGMTSTNSVGTQGFIPKVLQDGETVGYTGGNLDIAKMHEITRIMDVQGCAKENLWLMDIYQRQNFSDSIFAQFPAGSFVFGKNEASEDAAIAFGVQSIKIDEYLFKAKKYKLFNSETSTGKSPATDFFRNFGIICPQGSTRDAKDSTKVYKNVQVMTQAPPKGGTIGNGIRVWQHGGGSQNPTNGLMIDKVEMLCYRGVRVTAPNQFVVVQAS